LGIGLTLVKSLVEMHGGSVEVRSEGEGRGSEFRVRLPIIVELPLATPPALAPEPAVSPKAKRRILVVDDNRAALLMLSKMVQLLGYEVEIAGDGLEAIASAAEFLPEVVLMDIGMPKMNGYEAARHIRQQPWGRKMTLIALTGWGQEEDKRKAREAGFDHHLVKPADPTELQQLMAAPISAPS
jgi:CheY-like chemotaxis protein